MRIRSLATTALVSVASITSVARAQAGGFNVDIGPNNQFGLPNSVYGGAANMPGYWNGFSANTGNSISLLDLAGSPSAVTLSVSGGAGDFELDDPNTMGNDQQLMDDFGVVLPGNNAVYTFSGLPNGSYDVYVYGWVPTLPSVFSQLDIAGGFPCPQLCGGPWMGGHVRGGTYVKESVLVSNGQLALTISAQPSSGAVCNAVQLDLTGTAPSGGIGASTALFDIDAADADVVKGITRAHGNYWVSGTRGSTPENVMLRYSTDTSHVLQQTITLTTGNQLMSSGGVAGRGTAPNTQLLTFEQTGGSIYTWTPGSTPAAPGGLTFVSLTNSSGKTEGYDPITDTFWILQPNGDIEKVTITLSGVITVIRVLHPPLGLGLVDLAFDYQSNVLWGFAQTSPCGGNSDLVQFIGLDPNNGALLGPEFFGEVSIPGPNLAIACDLDTPAEHPGYFSIVAVQQSAPNYKVMIYNLGVPIPAAGPTTFCTSGTTTNGCLAAIGSSGLPSASASSGFFVNVSGIEGQKQGLIFYGTNNSGFTPPPWAVGGSSFLCVKAPTQRTGAQSSGGTNNLCDGTMSVDFLAFQAANPTALGNPFAAGSDVFFQGWFRDPPAPKTTNLSNGLKVTLLP